MKYEQIPKIAIVGFSIFFFFFLMSLTVDAALTDGLIIYYTMDDVDITGTNVHTEVGDNNGTLTNAVAGGSGIINQGVIFDGLGDTLVSISNSGIEGDDPFSLNCWFYDNRTIDTAENYVFYGVGNDDDACALGYLTHNTANDDKFYGHLRGGCGNGDFSSTEYIPYNDWFMGTWVHNSTDDFWYLYINGVINDTYDLGANIILNAHPFWIGASDDSITWKSFNGTIDECALYNRTITDVEVSELYNSGAGLAYPFTGAGAEPTLTIVTDIANNTINYNELSLNITYNGTITNTDNDIFDCLLYDNITLLDTQFDVNLSNNQNFILNFTDVENDYLFNIKCNQIGATYNITNLTLLDGTLVSGNVSMLNTPDNVSIVYDEAVGTPGFLIQTNISSVTNLDELVLRYWYDGNPAHLMYLTIYNYTSDNYQNLFRMEDTGGYENIEYMFNGVTDFINNSVVFFGVNHTSSGNVNHRIYLDYLQLHDAGLNDTTGLYSFKVDTINPQLSLLIPSNLNNSNQVKDSELILKFNFSDTNLFAYNITIFDSVGDVWNSQNFFAENLTGTYYENQTTRILTDTGNFSVFAEVWDDHNPITKPVKNLSWYDDNTDLFAEDFTFEGDFKFNNKTYFYLEDNKYKVKLTFNEDSDVHYINVSATGSLRYIPSSKYKGHFVYLPKKRYIDFEGENVKNVNILSCGKDYCLEIELYEKSDEIELESIGDLNYASAEYFYYVFDENTILLQEINQTTHNIEDEMVTKGEIMIFIAFLPILIGFMLLVGSSMLGNDHIIMKLFLFVLALVTPIISFQYGIEVIDHYENSFTSIVSDIGVHAGIAAVIFVVVFIYFVIYSTVKIMEYLKTKKSIGLKY